MQCCCLYAKVVLTFKFNSVVHCFILLAYSLRSVQSKSVQECVLLKHKRRERLTLLAGVRLGCLLTCLGKLLTCSLEKEGLKEKNMASGWLLAF